MKLLTEIYRKEGAKREGKTLYREAVRAIIVRDRKLLMIYSGKNGDYKFPGGGVDGFENYSETLVREVLEEAGARIDRLLGEFGKVIEYDIPQEPDYEVFRMTSMYFYCHVHPELSDQRLDPYEADLDFCPVWVDIDTAIQANTRILDSGLLEIPRWTARETFVLKQLKQAGIVEERIWNA